MNYTIRLRGTDKKKVYIDPDGREGFYLYPAEVRRLKLSEGQELSGEALERIRREVAYPRAKKRAVGILAKRDCTEAELREKLRKSLHDSRSLEEAVSSMKSAGYVDDLAYARDYLLFKRERKSFRLMRLELKKKGIPDAVLEQVFEETEEQSEADVRPLVQKYIRRFETVDAAARQKICAHFCRKGYRPELIRGALDALLEESGEESGTT